MKKTRFGGFFLARYLSATVIACGA